MLGRHLILVLFQFCMRVSYCKLFIQLSTCLLDHSAGACCALVGYCV